MKKTQSFKSSQILFFTFFIIVCITITSYSFFHTETHWVNLEFHAFIESFGGIMAVFMAIFLLLKEKNEEYPMYYAFSLGMMSMGLILCFHAMVPQGNLFVFFYSVAGLLGGGFSSISALPAFSRNISHHRSLWWMVTLTVAAGCVFFLTFPERCPDMLTAEKQFTGTAVTINLMAGCFFTITLIPLCRNLFVCFDRKIFIFILLFFLFAISSFMFPISSPWDYDWWIWHLLRLIAFISISITMAWDYASLNRKLENLLKESGDINQKLENYTFTISHDLKEPIRSIRTFSEFIQEDYENTLDDEGKDYLSRIIKASDRMATMIEDLLLLSRVGRTDIDFSKTDINTLLNMVLNDIKPLIHEKEADVQYSEMPSIVCQPVWLERVFQNLITNSIKFCNDHTPVIKIEYRAKKDFHEFSVIDNGIGIDKSQFDKIFGLFRKAHQNRNIEGSGAGLAIVSSIIAEHKGKIWVDSSIPGKETVIRFTVYKHLKE